MVDGNTVTVKSPTLIATRADVETEFAVPVGSVWSVCDVQDWPEHGHIYACLFNSGGESMGLSGPREKLEGLVSIERKEEA